MHQVSKPRAANQSITEESGRPGTCRSKVGCEAMEEPCTNRIVPLGAPPGAALFQRKSLTSPLRVQCSFPCTDEGPAACLSWVVVMAGNVNGAARSFLAFYARIRRLRRGGGHDGQRNARYVPQAADASRPGSRRAAGDPREGSRHLADLDL